MKKNVILLLALMLLPLSLFAKQEVIDKAYMKCSYYYKWEFDTLEHKDAPREDLLYLQVGSHVSKCFSYYTYQCDSLLSTPDGEKEWTQLLHSAIKSGFKGSDLRASFPHKCMNTVVYKNYPEGKVTVHDYLSSQYYVYEDDLNPQNWNIEDSTKTVLGHECQKATCDFRGRQWTAWFATDVPISDGPWKFGGLPGLVMEVYDKGRQQYFCINGLQKVDNEPIEFGILDKRCKKPQKITRKEFNKAEIHEARNQNAVIEAQTGISLGASDTKCHRDLLERDY